MQRPADSVRDPRHAPSAEVTESLLSKLLLGFVERRVSAQTIADIVRAQIIEANIDASALDPTTCTGIIEAIANVRSVRSSLDIVAFFARRTDFPQFLSYNAALSTFLEALHTAPRLQTSTLPHRSRFLAQLAQSVAVHLLQLLHVRQFPPEDRSRLLTQFQNLPRETRAWLFDQAPGVNTLRDALISEHMGIPDHARPHAPMLAEPGDILAAILETPEHTLAKKSPGHFRCIPRDKFNTWRLESIPALRELLADDRHSAFLKRFLTEWFFDGLLRDTLEDEGLVAPLQRAFRLLMDGHGNDIERLKGFLLAIQRDLALTATELGVPQNSHPRFSLLQGRAEKILYPNLIPIVTEFLQIFAKQFAWWALQMPVQPADARIFTRTGWRWLRSIATGVWEDELRRPPGWIVSEASRFSVIIFRMAPSIWLHDYAPVLLERLHLETNRPGFRVTDQHLNYLEFLVRTLLKKSPLLRGRPEVLLLLRYLNRTSPQEESQLRLLETRYRMMAASRNRGRNPEEEFWLSLFNSASNQESPGFNPVATTLQVLLQILQLVASKTRRVLTP